MTSRSTHLPLDSKVHHLVLRGFLDDGFPPNRDELAASLSISASEVGESLQRLEVNHGLVLDPGSGEVWLAHPFSSTPTLFHVSAGPRGWWAPCIWCALGIAALVGDEPVLVKTRLGGDGHPCELRCGPDGIQPTGLLAHFPVPPARAWDNVHRHCACTLVFDDRDAIDRWCERYRIPRGEVLTLEHAAEFAATWYGNHLAEDWRKPTVAEARALFDRAGLTTEHWRLGGAGERF